MRCGTTTASDCSTRSATSTPRRAARPGLYRGGVRHLSRLTLTIAGLRPLLLAATPRDDNVLLTVNLTNPDVRGEGGRVTLPRGTLHITRSRFIWDGVCHEMIRVRNFALSTVSVELVVRFGSDFEKHRRRARAAPRGRGTRALRARGTRQRHAGLPRRG